MYNISISLRGHVSCQFKDLILSYVASITFFLNWKGKRCMYVDFVERHATILYTKSYTEHSNVHIGQSGLPTILVTGVFYVLNHPCGGAIKCVVPVSVKLERVIMFCHVLTVDFNLRQTAIFLYVFKSQCFDTLSKLLYVLFFPMYVVNFLAILPRYKTCASCICSCRSVICVLLVYCKNYRKDLVEQEGTWVALSRNKGKLYISFNSLRLGVLMRKDIVTK